MRRPHYRAIAAGDSGNDTTLLARADAGILFAAPANVVVEFPPFPAVESYDELKVAFVEASERSLTLQLRSAPKRVCGGRRTITPGRG